MVIAIRPIREIPFFKDYVKAKPINDGFSEDIKYIVWCNNKKYILKLSPLSKLDKKKMECKMLKSFKKLKLPKCYGCGSVDEYSYIIYDYIEGDNASIGIKKLTPDNQYEMGVIAGKALKALHVKEEANIDYKDIFSQRLETLKELNLSIPYFDKMVSIFYDNIDLAMSDGYTFCHGDFHPSNMITNESGLYYIDFDRCKIASPYLDFRRMFTFSRAVSVFFCRGQLEGYFGRPLTGNDFRKMLPFLIMDLLFGYIWVIDFGEEQIRVQNDIVKYVLEDFNNFETLIPNWYYFH